MTKAYLNPFSPFFWLLLWSIWTDVPGCSGDCDQGRKACQCRK